MADQIDSFIVRIWLEESGQELDRESWRGRITHVESGQSRYVTSLDEITTYFRAQIEFIEGR